MSLVQSGKAKRAHERGRTSRHKQIYQTRERETMRTTSKEVKERIREYLFEAMEAYAEVSEMAEASESRRGYVEEILRRTYSNFKKEMDWEVKRIGEQNTFTEWLKGLALPIDYCYADDKKHVQEWLKQSNEEAAKYDDEDADNLYWWLLTREFFAMVKKFHIKETVREGC